MQSYILFPCRLILITQTCIEAYSLEKTLMPCYIDLFKEFDTILHDIIVSKSVMDLMDGPLDG